MTDNVIISSEDKNGNEVKVMLKTASAQEYRDSQVEYNRAFRKALDSGALLRQKLSDYMKTQGIWNEEKQKQNDVYVEKITEMESSLKRGGIRLSEAKNIALELRQVRAQFRDFLSERNTLDQNSAEGQADNARFAELVRLCMLNPNTRQPYFPTQDDYDKSADQPWVMEAAGQLANMIYGLDPNYDTKLTENKFLKEFEFVDEDLRLVNEGGHLVDSEGRLISEEGRYVAYKTKKAEKDQDADKRYYVNREGEELIEFEDESGNISWEKAGTEARKPFLDDKDQPVEPPKAADEEPEAAKEEVVEEATEEKPKRKRKTTKAETDTEA